MRHAIYLCLAQTPPPYIIKRTHFAFKFSKFSLASDTKYHTFQLFYLSLFPTNFFYLILSTHTTPLVTQIISSDFFGKASLVY